MDTESSNMDITFITMHDLSEDAHIQYASHSITDVLGYEPSEVVGKSCFEFFDPQQIPIARQRHGRGVQLDKAAVLAYCRLQAKDGSYRVCECVFTVVYTVVVTAISIRRSTLIDHERVSRARDVRHNFDDPRYSMIRHLSPKFISPPSGQHEVRAALILNRFTRALNVMYATHALEDLFGLHPDEFVDRSFYECIQEPFLQSAVTALERAKENNSIAYLVFTWRDPRPHCGQIGSRRRQHAHWKDEDEDMQSSGSEDEDEDIPQPVIFVEAVVSCTSDGLVVVLRHSRFPPTAISQSPVLNDFCASPWAESPMMPRPVPDIDYMESIRQVAVFAWCVQSLNHTIKQYAKEGDYDHTEVLPARPPSYPPYPNQTSADSSGNSSPVTIYGSHGQALRHHLSNGIANRAGAHFATTGMNGKHGDGDSEMH